MGLGDGSRLAVFELQAQESLDRCEEIGTRNRQQRPFR